MVVNRITGTTSKVILGEEAVAWGTEAASYNVEFGWIQNFKWNSDASTQKMAHLNGSVNYAANVDGVESVSGSLEWGITSGLEFEYLMGAISGTGPYAITQSYPLPSMSVQAQYNTSTVIKILGLVFQKFNIQLSKEQWVKCTADWIARSWSYAAGTVTPYTPTDDPFTYLDGYLTVGGTNFASLTDLTIEVDMKTEALRGIESVSASDRRLATGYVSKITDINLNLTAEVINEVELNKYLGGSSIQDSRADVTAVLNLALGSRAIAITLTGVRLNNIGGESPADGEVRTIDTAGSALSIAMSVTTA